MPGALVMQDSETAVMDQIKRILNSSVFVL